MVSYGVSPNLSRYLDGRSVPDGKTRRPSRFASRFLFFTTQQRFARPCEAGVAQIADRRHAARSLEMLMQGSSRNACRPGDIKQRDRIAQMRFDEVDGARHIARVDVRCEPLQLPVYAVRLRQQQAGQHDLLVHAQDQPRCCVSSSCRVKVVRTKGAVHQRPGVRREVDARRECERPARYVPSSAVSWLISVARVIEKVRRELPASERVQVPDRRRQHRLAGGTDPLAGIVDDLAGAAHRQMQPVVVPGADIRDVDRGRGAILDVAEIAARQVGHIGDEVERPGVARPSSRPNSLAAMKARVWSGSRLP